MSNQEREAEPSAQMVADVSAKMREVGASITRITAEKARSITIRIKYHSGDVQEFEREFPLKDKA